MYLPLESDRTASISFLTLPSIYQIKTLIGNQRHFRAPKLQHNGCFFNWSCFTCSSSILRRVICHRYFSKSIYLCFSYNIQLHSDLLVCATSATRFSQYHWSIISVNGSSYVYHHSNGSWTMGTQSHKVITHPILCVKWIFNKHFHLNQRYKAA